MADGYEIIYSEDNAQFGVGFPDGSETELQDVPESGNVVMAVDDDDVSKGLLLVALSDAEEPLTPDTIYLLQAQPTEVTEVDAEDAEEEPETAVAVDDDGEDPEDEDLEDEDMEEEEEEETEDAARH